MKKTAITLLAALCLTGCANPTAPAKLTTTPALPPHASAADPQAVRHLLEVSDGQARMWGLRYYNTTETIAKVDRSKCDLSQGGYWAGNTWFNMECMLSLGWDVSWAHTGAGTFETIGHHPENVGWRERFTYTVPDDQVLVINEVGGTIAINAFDVSSSQREKVDYLFGAGEVVIFNLERGGFADGFTADPALLGAGSKSARSAK
jgi:hypothetical protein